MKRDCKRSWTSFWIHSGRDEAKNVPKPFLLVRFPAVALGHLEPPGQHSGGRSVDVGPLFLLGHSIRRWEPSASCRSTSKATWPRSTGTTGRDMPGSRGRGSGGCFFHVYTRIYVCVHLTGRSRCRATRASRCPPTWSAWRRWCPCSRRPDPSTTWRSSPRWGWAGSGGWSWWDHNARWARLLPKASCLLWRPGWLVASTRRWRCRTRTSPSRWRSSRRSTWWTTGRRSTSTRRGRSSPRLARRLSSSQSPPPVPKLDFMSCADLERNGLRVEGLVRARLTTCSCTLDRDWAVVTRRRLDDGAQLHQFGKTVGGLLAFYEIRAAVLSRLQLLGWGRWQGILRWMQ